MWPVLEQRAAVPALDLRVMGCLLAWSGLELRLVSALVCRHIRGGKGYIRPGSKQSHFPMLMVLFLRSHSSEYYSGEATRSIIIIKSSIKEGHH
jgi:hypothetical protein